MNRVRTIRIPLVATVLVAAGACASAGPWEAHDRSVAERSSAARSDGTGVCPVVLTNQTDQQLDAGYVLAGVQSELGLIPAGRSLSFGVSCSSGQIEAFGFAQGAFLGEGPEYRTLASLEREQPTRVGLTIVNRIR
jgi:hypothetical protein